MNQNHPVICGTYGRWQVDPNAELQRENTSSEPSALLLGIHGNTMKHEAVQDQIRTEEGGLK